MAATCVLSRCVVERMELSSNRYVLAYPCRDMKTNIANREEVNVQCLK